MQSGMLPVVVGRAKMVEAAIKYVIEEFGLVVEIESDGSAFLQGTLKEDVPGINDEGLKEYNAAMDGIESLILGHAAAGIDVTSKEYLEGLRSAVEGCANNI